MSLLVLLLAAQVVAADPLAPLAEPVTRSRPRAERVVRRGETITLRIARGPLTISTPARALGDAAAGERVRVTVPSTRRTLDAVAEAPGVARLPTL